MSDWVTKYLPFIRGLDLSKDALLDGESFTVAENVDWDHQGAIRGRPSRVAPMQFVVSDLANNSVVTPTFSAPMAFAATGFTSRGLVTVHDLSGAHPALACDGRLFVASEASGLWVDRGRFACARVDRLYDYLTNQTSIKRLAVAPDFGPMPLLSFGYQGVQLLDSDFEPQQALTTSIATSLTTGTYGTGTRSGTTTAMVEVLGVNLNFIYRTAGAAAVTVVTLATNAASPSVFGNYTAKGDSACIAPSGDGTGFWVVYRTMTTDQYTVLRVSLTGTVTHSFSEVRTGFKGFWVDGLPSGGAAVAVTDGTNLYTRTLDSSANQIWASQLAVTAQQVVIGATSNSAAWWATAGSEGGGLQTITIGTATLTNGAAPVSLRSYYSGDTSKVGAGLRWSIAHQPVTLHGRTYITLVAAILGSDFTTTGLTGTWVTLDVTDLSSSNQTPTLVARGNTETTIPHGEASTAVPLADGSGWTFPTMEWSRIEATKAELTTGTLYSLGLNRVTLSGPRAVQVGTSTVFSGSIPYIMGQNQCWELGFPFLGGQPGISVAATAGGAYIGIGQTITYQAVWRWTDDNGVVHRSAPSVPATATGSSGNNSVTVTVTTPQLSGHPDAVVEVYSTIVDPTADDPLYLQATITPGSPWNAGQTSVVFNANATPDTTTEILYTDGGVFENVHVPGDGGIAALGRRLWLASADTVYASKLLTAGEGPGFNDTGALQISVPAGVGRILALETIDTRLIILCEHGVYQLADGGPDNEGNGLDFGAPMRVTELGVAGPRSSCRTPAGVVFVSPLDGTDYQRGGPWLLTLDGSVMYLGDKVRDHLLANGSFVPEVDFSPERDVAFVSYDTASGTGVIVLDNRYGRFATWANQDGANGAQTSMCCAGGVLWTMCTEPAAYSGAPGSDVAGSYTMTLTTGHLPVFQDGSSWGRVRSVVPVGTPRSGAYTLNASVVMDQTRSASSGAQTIAAAGSGTAWPSSRQEPEWRLPTQKCSTIQVTLAASPATAEWAALALRTRPITVAAPPAQRF